MPETRIQFEDDLLPREQWPPIGDNCPIARALDVVSTRSAFLILREAFYGATRFEQFVERAEISEPVAASRLRELTAVGLFEKVPYREPGQRARDEYHLTEMGAELLPAIVALFEWGSRWRFPDRAPRLELDHAGCGGRLSASLHCEHGHPVELSAVELRSRRARA